MSPSESSQICPLCSNQNGALYWIQSKTLQFFQCSKCHLIFKDPAVRLAAEEEKKRYLTHNNSLEDPRYREYLEPLFRPLQISPNALGLDYGCGPTRAFADLSKEKGLACHSYDPHFFPDGNVFNQRYDFIVCSEAAEHFYFPAKEFERIFSSLKEKGRLILRTGLVPTDFQNWWYHRDPTHVAFYTSESLNWLSRKYGARLEFYPGNIVAFALN